MLPKVNVGYHSIFKFLALDISDYRIISGLAGVQLKLMAASKLSGLLEFLLGPVIVPRPIGPVNA
jgi:hypothetical protein